MSLSAEQRAIKADLERKIKALESPDKKIRKAAMAKARRERRESLSRTQGQRNPSEQDGAFASWQHDEGLPCIACLIEGPPPVTPNPIEVAHQKVNSAKWGRTIGMGPKTWGADSCPLCRWHHQGAPNACDRNRVKFWARLQIDPIEFCTALYAAFKSNGDGSEVVRAFTTQGEGR